VAPRIAAEIEGSGAALKRRGFVDGDVRGQAIVFAATGLEAVDDRVATAARQAGLPVNVVDRPRESSFIMPAIVERDPIFVAISSGGAAPVLARRLRGRSSGSALAPRPARLFRRELPQRRSRPARARRRRFWEGFFEAPSLNRCWRGEGAGARAMLSLVNAPE
jgi:uroporphyrin-III C-methyltransferase/precorrin-2 dehydrogenase/sirohydrochlorin ferrochelatase